MTFISVDLPEPDAPMMAKNWPAGISNDTSLSATTSTSPSVYTLKTCSSSIKALTGFAPRPPRGGSHWLR